MLIIKNVNLKKFEQIAYLGEQSREIKISREQKAEIPASCAPVGRAAHARLITILFDDSPPP